MLLHRKDDYLETLVGFRNKYDNKTNKIIVMLEPRSNTMKMNLHNKELIESLKLADYVYLYAPENLKWDTKA